MQPAYFPAKLKSARQMKGLSLQGLSDKMNKKLSKQALNLYEKGKTVPTKENLMLLCEALEVPSDYFNRPEVKLTKIEFRKRTSLPVKEQNRIESLAQDFISRYLELESLSGMQIEFSNPLKNREVNSFDDVEARTLELRKEWKLGDEPLNNVAELLEEKGIKVYEIETDTSFDGMAAVAGSDIYVIVLKKIDDVPRMRFTALHELAHLILKMPEGIDEGLKELYCHYFANNMLFPRKRVETELGGKRKKIYISELLVLKEQYGISMQAMLYRFRQIELISENYFQQSMKLLKNRYGKTSEPPVFKGREKTTRMGQLVLRGVAEEFLSLSKAADLLGMDAVSFNEYLSDPL